MKKIVLFLVSVFILVGCKETINSPMVGMWDVNDVFTIVESGIMQEHDGSCIYFDVNGTGLATERQPVEFEWDVDNNVLYVTSDLFDVETQMFDLEYLDDDLTQKYTINVLNENQCVLERTFNMRTLGRDYKIIEIHEVLTLTR